MKIGKLNTSGGPSSTRRPARNLGRITLALLISAAISGCTFPTAKWSPAESPKNNAVEWIRFDHKVNFDDIGARLTKSQKDRLTKFLATLRAGYGDDIVVEAPGLKNGAREIALADRRLQSVAKHVKDMNLRIERIGGGRKASKWDGSVNVMVGRYIVIAPKCPDWTKPADSDWTNKEASNLGCATNVNLGLMLADPGELVRVKPITPSDGQRGATQVQKYRAGDVDTATATVGGGN